MQSHPTYFFLFHTVSHCWQRTISELRRRWNQTGASQAASSWHLPSSFHLPYGLELFPPWHVPCLRIKAGLLVGHLSIYNQHTPAVCSSFHYGAQTQSSPDNQPWRLREGREIYMYSSFNFDNRWRRVVNSTLLPPYPREKWPSIHFTGGQFGPQVRSGGVWKFSPTSGFDSQTVQLVEGQYIDYAIRNHTVTDLGLNLLDQLIYLLVSVTRITELVNLVEWRKVHLTVE